MAYFEIIYYVFDITNSGIVYKLKESEAKEMVVSGRGKLFDSETQTFVETPEEWLSVVEENVIVEISSNEGTQTLEELQKLYVETFGKELSIRYKNDIERIKSKLYS